MQDVLIQNGHVVTMDGQRRVYEDGAVTIKDAELTAVGPTEEIAPTVSAETVVDASGRAVLPGFITTHVHVSDILLRGGDHDSRGVYDWLYNVKVPGISAMTPEEHGIAASLYCREALRGGMTTFVENAIGRGTGFNREIISTKLDRYDQMGIRSVYAQAFSDVTVDGELKRHLERVMAKEPNVEHVSPATCETDDAIDEINDLIDTYHGTADGRLSVWPAPYLTWGVSPEGFKRALELARRHDIMTTTHVSETPLQERGTMSSIEYLDTIGYLNEQTLLGHCVYLEEPDIRRLARSGTKVAHNVVTNLALGDGIAPVPTMREYGVTVGMGTDNASASDTVNLVNDIRFASLVHKGNTCEADALMVDDVLAMATIEAARAIGRSDDLGSLEVGKLADVVLLDLDYPHLRPSFDVPTTIVNQAQGFEVETVICNGEIVVRNGVILSADEEFPNLTEDAQHAAEAIRERTGLDSLRD